MKPSLGRIVHYTLNDSDAAQIKMQRAEGWPNGNPPSAGQVYPMMITRVWGETEESSVNGQVLLDGNDSLWVTSRSQGEGASHWIEPPRV